MVSIISRIYYTVNSSWMLFWFATVSSKYAHRPQYTSCYIPSILHRYGERFFAYVRLEITLLGDCVLAPNFSSSKKSRRLILPRTSCLILMLRCRTLASAQIKAYNFKVNNRLRFWTQTGIFNLSPQQNQVRDQPNSYSMVIEYSSPEINRQGIKLTVHVHLLPRIRICGVVHPCPCTLCT
jgi:hypothetical protein